MNFTIIPSSRSYFPSSYCVPSPVLATGILRGIRMGMVPGDLTLQLGEGKEFNKEKR